MSTTAEALFGNKPTIEQKEAGKGFAVSYQLDYKELNFGKELGRGGFGVVHQGTWRKHTDVAIKQLLSDDISHEAKEEFEAESQVMARLRSPNIVQFYGYCLNPRHCIVMEYMPNGSLYSILKNIKQSLDWTIRIRIATDIASGLDFLHQEHIVHRDIKSLNVLLDQSYRAKLTDFGLSKVKTETKSQSMATKTSKDAVGTIAWMAPELFKRKAVYTSKSDIYSLGITFWELAARKIPYSESPQEVISTFVREGEREDIPKDCPQKLASLIVACWESSPDKRPDADAVVTYLKSDKTNFAQFLPLFVSHRASEYQRTLHSTPTVTVHQGNFNSTLSGFNHLHVSPPVPKPAIPEQKNPPAILTQLNQVAKPAPRVSASDLTTFLRLVAEGEQERAEAMLKKNPDLALVPGDVRDLSKRTFRGITAFQYAVWALDWHMWTMIRKYLPPEAAQLQAQGFEMGSWVKSHGIHAQSLLENLIKALQPIIDLCYANKDSALFNSEPNTDWIQQANTAWVQQVGGAQRLLPVHVINEYCHPRRSLYPVPNFRDATTLPRTRVGGEWEWFTALSVGAAWGRNGGDYAHAWPGGCAAYSVFSFDLDPDSIRELSSTRTAQREELITQLNSRNTQREAVAPVEKLNLLEQKNSSESNTLAQFQAFIKSASLINASDLTAFLRLVAEGEQDKVEAILKNNPTLALLPGDVTDLSGRMFTGITAFQYAVWALDWHMWTMIRKYLPIEDARLQAQGFETGHWVKSHGVHAQKLLDDLIKAYKTAIDFHKVSKVNEYSKAWKRLGGFQFLLPAHVINEYCHPTRPFFPIPNFEDTLALPRNRTINGIDADNNEGDCFAFLYHDGNTNGDAICRSTRRMAALGPRLVLYQTEHGSMQCEAMETDYESICALTSIRTAQRKDLIVELRGKRVQKRVA
ncbi:MAG TPA: protein kinase [Gammaproteobacteria bacterium]|nr:protein kinase [Gammaproteobacteria bacterium]